ncbi:acyltransferase family protein [Flavobacterium sp. RSB2_4_14]|uniref:acyltransferase family protein n=1 Tax=Flavobacterium sp. RSB2_4_14 TaxID=3447665 RepID=UPI003F33CB61
MTILNPLFAVILFTIAYLTAYIINLRYKSTENIISRYENIDGLRGFLALGVFIHHSTIWFQYIQIDHWKLPKSNLYTHLGQTSVAFFFMITSFLFVSKLINSAEKGFNWRSFFISRIYRLTPMYYVSIIIIMAIVMTITNWELRVGLIEFLHSIFMWSTYTIIERGSINGFDFTSKINAGVTWSLPYEWLFYFSLPIISLFILKIKPTIFYIGISLFFVLGFFYLHGFEYNPIFSFFGGMVAPFIIKYYPKINTQNIIFSFIILLCLILIGQFEKANMICKILTAIIFTLVALGNTFFGILKYSTLKFLGEMCYSTYLLHGIVLFVVIYFGIGIEAIKHFSPIQYSLVIFLITPIVVIISFWGYKFVEKPYMEKSKKINNYLNNKYNR